MAMLRMENGLSLAMMSSRLNSELFNTRALPSFATTLHLGLKIT